MPSKEFVLIVFLILAYGGLLLLANVAHGKHVRRLLSEFEAERLAWEPDARRHIAGLVKTIFPPDKYERVQEALSHLSVPDQLGVLDNVLAMVPPEDVPPALDTPEHIED